MGYVSASHLRRDYNACNENLTWYIIKRTDFNGGISIKPYTKFELFYVANMDPFGLLNLTLRVQFKKLMKN